MAQLKYAICKLVKQIAQSIFFLFLLLQVQTVYETFSVENADSIYMASLEASLETDTTLFITLCIRYDVICLYFLHFAEYFVMRFLTIGQRVAIAMCSGFEILCTPWP